MQRKPVNYTSRQSSPEKLKNQQIVSTEQLSLSSSTESLHKPIVDTQHVRKAVIVKKIDTDAYVPCQTLKRDTSVLRDASAGQNQSSRPISTEREQMNQIQNQPPRTRSQTVQQSANLLVPPESPESSTSVQPTLETLQKNKHKNMKRFEEIQKLAQTIIDKLQRKIRDGQKSAENSEPTTSDVVLEVAEKSDVVSAITEPIFEDSTTNAQIPPAVIQADPIPTPISRTNSHESLIHTPTTPEKSRPVNSNATLFELPELSLDMTDLFAYF